MSRKSATKASRGIPCDPYLIYGSLIRQTHIQVSVTLPIVLDWMADNFLETVEIEVQ